MTSARRTVEVALRLAGVGAIVLALVLALRAPDTSRGDAPSTLSAAALYDSSARATVNELSATIARAALDSAPSGVHLTLTGIPSSSVRAALATVVHAGLRAAWTDSTNASGLAIAATAIADPFGGTLVRARANASVPLTIRDDASTLDSIASARNGVTVRGARLSGTAQAAVGSSRARVTIPRPPTLRRVLLLARPGWEAKFTTAALEERGWQVEGRLPVARRASVTLGGTAAASGAVTAPLDTARYAAAIVLDSGLVSAGVLSRFLRQGGGVILSGDALLGTSFGALRPATIVGVRALVPGALLTDAPRRGLAAWELRAAVRSVVLQAESHDRHDDSTVVAWRLGNGRVLASAYRDSWRWRMEGRDDGLDAHRAWWSALVGAVAFVPAVTEREQRPGNVVEQRLPGDAAPYADLRSRLGAPVAPPASMRSTPPAPSRRWLLYLVASLALLGEWALRRTRGAP